MKHNYKKYNLKNIITKDYCKLSIITKDYCKLSIITKDYCKILQGGKKCYIILL